MEFEKYNQESFKVIRQVLNYTQQQIADICGMSRQTIHNVENNKNATLPTITLIGICLDRIAEEDGKANIIDIIKNDYKKSD